MLAKVKIILILCYLLTKLGVAEEGDSAREEELFKKLFKQQRAQQLEVIRNMQKMSTEKQYSMIFLMAESVFSTIQDSRATMEAAPYIPGISPFPLDLKTKEALAHILQNTALFSETILRLPDVTVSVLKTNNNWDVLLQWSISFCSQVQNLLDSSTLKLLDLVTQELNHTPRHPDYVNPYKQQNVPQARSESYTVPVQKIRKPIKKGPRLSGNFEL